MFYNPSTRVALATATLLALGGLGRLPHIPSGKRDAKRDAFNKRVQEKEAARRKAAA